MKHINDSKESNYIIAIPTTNIATDFYNNFIKPEDTIKLYINDDVFKVIKLIIDNNVRVIFINTYHQASRYLGRLSSSLMEINLICIDYLNTMLICFYNIKL